MKYSATLFLSFLFFLSLSSQNTILKDQDHDINKALSTLISYKENKTASIAFLAIDINSGETLAELNSFTSLKPASTQKLLTTAAALEILGSDYRFETRIEYSGTIDSLSKTLHGDIYITGSGDPSLGSEHFEQTKRHQFLNQWVKAIKETGIKRIDGRIIADAGILPNDNIPPSWSWINIGNYFGAAPNGLTIFDNLYRIHFTTAAIGSSTQITKTDPYIPGLSFENYSKAAHIWYDKSNIFGAPYTYHRVVKGELPANKKNFKVKGAIPDPAFLAAYILDSLLTNEDISISGEPTTNRSTSTDNNTSKTLIHTTFSPTLNDIVYQTNQKSINLFAEHLLLETALNRGIPPETEIALDSLISFWANKGMDTQGLILYDGSGLSQYNAINAQQMVFLLKYMKTQSTEFHSFERSLSIAGKTGTLEFMFKNTPSQGLLIAKSGTIDNVKAYAGYTKTKLGRDIAFYIMINNYTGKTSLTTKRIETLLNAITKSNF